MTRIRVKGFQKFRDRHGRMRFYDCATRLAVCLRKAPLGPEEFPTEYGRIAALAEAQAPPQPQPQPQPKEGPLEGIVAHYLVDDGYREIAQREQTHHQ